MLLCLPFHLFHENAFLGICCLTRPLHSSKHFSEKYSSNCDSPSKESFLSLIFKVYLVSFTPRSECHSISCNSNSVTWYSFQVLSLQAFNIRLNIFPGTGEALLRVLGATNKVFLGFRNLRFPEAYSEAY